MIGLALLAMGAGCLWAALTGRADAVLNALSISLPAAGVVASGGAGGDSGGGGGGKSPTLWNVPIQGPDGSTGVIQVVSSDPTGATQDAGQGGNIPIGDPTPA